MTALPPFLRSSSCSSSSSSSTTHVHLPMASRVPSICASFAHLTRGSYFSSKVLFVRSVENGKAKTQSLIHSFQPHRWYFVSIVHWKRFLIGGHPIRLCILFLSLFFFVIFRRSKKFFAFDSVDVDGEMVYETTLKYPLSSVRPSFSFFLRQVHQVTG